MPIAVTFGSTFYGAAVGNKQPERIMSKAKVQDWTDSVVLLKFDQHKDVKYQVYREEQKHFLEMRDPEDTHIHTLELPDGMKFEKSSYEVLLRYVLLDVIAH